MRDISKPIPQLNNSFGSIYNQIVFFLLEKNDKEKNRNLDADRVNLGLVLVSQGDTACSKRIR
jgi:hypothetical protein